MHKGRKYRRVLPPAKSPNYADDGNAPVRIFIEGDFVWLGQIVRIPPESMSGKADATNPRALIAWETVLTLVGHTFHILFGVQLHEHTPDTQFQLGIVDDIGGSLTLSTTYSPEAWLWSPVPQFVDWGSGPHITTGFFGPLLDFKVSVVRYHDEP